MNPLDLIPAGYRWLAIGLALAALAAAWQVDRHLHGQEQYEAGQQETQQRWDAAISRQRAAALEQAAANAQETERRLKAQQENQNAQNAELAAARRDAATNAAAAEQLRGQLADTASRWRAALGNSPAGSQCQAAGDAIGVFADVLGRADRRAGILAEVADAARAAGLKCERDYEALTAKP